MSKVYIYTISDPLTEEVRYVGKTINPSQRFISHRYAAKKHYVACWIRKLKSQGLKPMFHIVDEVDDSSWQFWEQFYICLFKSWGFRLNNITAGGDGALKMTAWNKGKTGMYSPEHIQKLKNINRKGEKNNCSKLTDIQVLEIRKRANNGEKQKNLAKEFGIACGTLNRIVLRKSYSHLK